jgi:hypothetical protein
MGGGTALFAWIATSLALGALAWFWQRRSPLLWALAAALVYSLVEDPSIGPMRGDGRFLPIDHPLIGTLSSAAITGALLAVAMTALPRREGKRGRRVRHRGHRALPPADEAKQCPACVETIRASAPICPFCGHRFEAKAS